MCVKWYAILTIWLILFKKSRIIPTYKLRNYCCNYMWLVTLLKLFCLKPVTNEGYNWRMEAKRMAWKLASCGILTIQLMPLPWMMVSKFSKIWKIILKWVNVVISNDMWKTVILMLRNEVEVFRYHNKWEMGKSEAKSVWSE